MVALNTGVYVIVMVLGIVQGMMQLMCAEPTKPPVVTTVRQMTIYIKEVPGFRSCVIVTGITARADVMEAGHAKIRSEHTFVMKMGMFLKNVKTVT